MSDTATNAAPLEEDKKEDDREMQENYKIENENLKLQIQTLQAERESSKQDAEDSRKSLIEKNSEIKKLQQDIEGLKKQNESSTSPDPMHQNSQGTHETNSEIGIPEVAVDANQSKEGQDDDVNSLKMERDKYKRESEESRMLVEKLSGELKLAEDALEMKKKELESNQPFKLGGRDIEEVIEEKNRMIKSLEDELNRLEREHEDALQRLDDSNHPNEASEEVEESGEIPYDVLDRLDDELAGAKHELSLKIDELKMCREAEDSLRKRLDEALQWKEQALAAQQDLTAARNALASKEKEIEEERQIRRAIEARYDEKLKLKVCVVPRNY